MEVLLVRLWPLCSRLGKAKRGISIHFMCQKDFLTESVAYSVSTKTVHTGEPIAFKHASRKNLMLNCKGRAEITYTKMSWFFLIHSLYSISF